MKIYLDNNLGVTNVEQEELTQDTIGYNILKVYIPNAVLTPYDTFTCYYGALLQNGRKVGWFAMEARTSTDADYEANYTLYKATLEQCVVSVEGKVYIGCQILLGNSGNATLIKKNTAVVQFNVRKSVAINNDILVLDPDQTTTDVLESYKNLLENALLTYATKAEVYTKTQMDAFLLQKQNVLTFDSTPTANSTNPVTSGGVKTALDTKADSTTVSGIDNRVGVLETDIADLKSVQNVVEVVATYSALQSYDTSKLDVNDKVQVIADETHDGASTIYNWSGTQWQYVGAYGTNSYTKDEINNYKKMWDNLVYSCGFTIDDSAKTMTISGNWAFTKYSFIVIDNIAVKTISYASLSLGNYCLVIRNNALEFVNFANAIQDGDMVLWIGFLDGTGDIRTDIYRCNNKVTNLALYCSDNIKIDTTNKNFVIPNSYLFWNSGYASITAQNISYANYLNATCVLVYRNGVFKVLLLQNIELFYNDVIVAVVWFRGDGFPLSKIYVVNEAPDKAITELPLSSKIFMRVGVIGDSYTSGWIKDNDHKNNPNYSWVKYMKQLTGNEWTNFGVSGSSTKSWVDGTLGQLPQVQTKGNKCQAYVIGLMINDQNTGASTYVPLGTSSDIGTNANSYYAYYYKLINALLSVNSSAIIFCNTCPRTDGDFPSYNQAVIDVVNYCQSESKNVYLVELRNYYWRNETFNNDALNGHYTAIGYEYMAEIFNKAFSDTINENASSLKEVNLIPYDSATVYDYVDQKINDLRWELGSHTLDVESDTTTSFSKSVPANTIGCQINQIGGMSYKSENLANPNNTTILNNTSDNYAVVIKITGLNLIYGKSYKISFDVNGSTYIGSDRFRYYINTNDYYNYSGIDNAYSNGRKTINISIIQNATTLEIRFSNNGVSGVMSGVITNVMVYESSTVLPYQPYFSGIRDSAVTSVVSKGANLLQLNDVAETTTNGVTYSVSNGVITLNGTASANGLLNPFYLTNNVYMNGNFTLKWFSGLSDNQNIGVDVYFNGTSLNVNDFEVLSRSYDNLTLSNIRFYIPSGRTFDNFKLKPMLVSGITTPTEFIKYNGTIDTLNISSAIQNLTGYGWGINDTCYNYIDFVNKKFIQKVGRVDLGTLTWTSWSGSQSALLATISQPAKEILNTTIPSVISNYEAKTRSDIYNGNDGISISGSSVYYKGGETPTGYLYYELATPIETDISAYLTTDTIDVEPLGTLEFTNTYSQDVPSDIDYLIEEVKA